MKRKKVFYIIEDTNWSITADGKNIVSHLKKNKGNLLPYSSIGTFRRIFLQRNSYIHFGSFNIFMNEIKKYKRKWGNIIIATCFHIVDGDPRADKIAELDKYVDKWHTSCNITKHKLVQYGVTEEKIVVIPLGVDLTKYYPFDSNAERLKLRAQIGVKEGQIVVGSFQKDGNGWGKGVEPKLIKGPDVFCNVIEKLASKYDIFVLLSGPARGYVKKRLEEAGIPYYHTYLEDPDDVARLYQLIDIYLVTSREEGGPKAILESMASGVPIVTTKVGMAPDIIKSDINGVMVDVEDENGIINAFERIVMDSPYRKRLIEGGLSTAGKYDIEDIVKQYEELLYTSPN